MSLVLTEQGNHTWVATAGASGPILAIDGHRLLERTTGGAGAAARPAAVPEHPGTDTVDTPGPAAAGDVDPTITTRAWALPGDSFGVLELVRIGTLHLIVPDSQPQR